MHSYVPTVEPIARPTAGPAVGPTAGPTANPTVSPTVSPTTVSPTKNPIVSLTTVSPTKAPITHPMPAPTIIEEDDLVFLPVCDEDSVVLKQVGSTNISLQKMKPFELYSSNKPGTHHRPDY